MNALKTAAQQQRRIFVKTCNKLGANENNLSSGKKFLKVKWLKKR